MNGYDDWALVAPWWAWPRPAAPRRGRGTPPLLQKYDNPRLVEEFLRDPQRRLQFVEEVDRVTSYAGTTPVVPTPGQPARRKLFQPSHFRHYLVVCSLHCDAPGMPPVDRARVCQQGFVIRKRSVTATGADSDLARRKVAAVNAARRTVSTIDAQIAAARLAPRIAGVRLAALQVRRDAAVTVLSDAAASLRSWAEDTGLSRSLQGWRSGPNDGEGHWEETSELPEDVTEHWFPLYPLIAPDVTARAPAPPHDAAGETIYFGVIPTGSADHDTTSRGPRFDDVSAYELRCFVRRHAPECPSDEPGLAGRTADCRGAVVWSEPSEVFGLAAHFDLRGTSHRPINVQLPDLRELRAHAGQAPVGVQFITPPFSAVGGNGPGGQQAAQICSFSIPLITIVAMFVFQLFLPIVVLLFQLWFLLLLKFCIPPEVKAGDALNAVFDLSEPELAGAPASIDATMLAGLDGALGLSEPGKRIANGTLSTAHTRFDELPRAERWRLLRRLYGREALAAPVEDLKYVDRVERDEVEPVW